MFINNLSTIDGFLKNEIRSLWSVRPSILYAVMPSDLTGTEWYKDWYPTVLFIRTVPLQLGFWNNFDKNKSWI